MTTNKVKFKCSYCGWRTQRKWKKWFSDTDLTCPKCQTYGGFAEYKTPTAEERMLGRIKTENAAKERRTKKYITAFELCGQYDDQHFKLKGGRVVWEAISYRDKIDKCYISRVVETGGKPWFMGLNMQDRYIDPDTEVFVVVG